MSMPDGAMKRARPSEARELLTTSPFLLVNVELPERTPPNAQPLVSLFGLDVAAFGWLGRDGESVRAEFLGDSAGFVLPAVEAGRVVHIHAVVTETYLITVHRGATGLLAGLTSRFPHERPADAVATLFLLLDEALETYRRTAVRALLDVEDLEDEMFRQRLPEQVYRLSRLRRSAALLHRTLLPYTQVMEETVTRRMMSAGFPEARQRLVREYQRTAKSTLTNIESLQDAARRAFASHSSLVSGDQNGVLNRLAIVSTIFLPLTFLTGFFGMNFAYLTNELDSRAVFWLLAVGLQVVFLAMALFGLHRTGLWRRLQDGDGRIEDD
ncbi:CorA family divalent cation transporter [Streptomyces sp. NPDC046866]|uniref:magnesium transporter CorA family protein n=1 Tax=Streptomyces sp. NPDC046866 TaxID=3154921 RepID=UPI003456EDA0